MKKVIPVILILFLFHLLSIISYSQVTCNNWLYIGGNRSCVRISSGIEISGSKMTVECLFNRTTAYQPISQGGGDLISNHCDPTTVNYLLRPNSAQITTSNGFFAATDNGTILLNRTYHVALVYNDTTLSLYRDGVLIKQVPATGTLKTNYNYSTAIGRTACLESSIPTDFVGYINEVRLWNVARSQSQIQAAKNSVLPNPTTQPGLIAYYTFNSLNNKANNNYFGYLYTDNGSPNANINATNPSTTYSICEVPPTNPPNSIPVPSNSYLKVSGTNSGVTVGNLNITGNKLTIEAICIRTTNYNALYEGGDIVSKHCMPSDVSYFLRPNQAGIRTTNGVYIVTADCKILTNQFYHVALIYDGFTLKLYRDREIVADTAASGNLLTNNWPTSIGREGCTTPIPAEFIGYINEVRFWNAARTMSQLETYEYSQLENPTTQPNLIAYYTFNTLNNKHNIGTYPGTIVGSATIKQTATWTQYGANCSCALCAVVEPERLRPAATNTSSEDNTVSPNPAHDFINFKSIDNTEQYCIINAFGMVVKKFKVEVGTNKIYIGDFTNGVYMIKPIDSRKKVLKFLKQ
jgi:hypothetical protein